MSRHSPSALLAAALRREEKAMAIYKAAEKKCKAARKAESKAFYRFLAASRERSQAEKAANDKVSDSRE